MAVDPRIAKAYTGFGLQLFSKVAGAEPGKNVFIAPSSVAFVLSMLYSGAGGTTRDAMAQTLDVQGLTLQDVNSAYLAWC